MIKSQTNQLMKYILYILFFIPIYLFAQPITATLSADSSHILIGNPLTLRLSITSDNSLQVVVPTLQDSLGKWEILQTSPVVKGNERGKTIFSQNIVVTAWDSGHYEIPALAIRYMNEQDTAMVSTNPIAIRVLTVSVDTTQAIKPIKAPLQTTYMWQEAIPYLGFIGLLLIIGIGYFIYKKYQANRKKAMIPLSPREKALKSFAEISTKELLSPQDVKEYYARISYILRDYISHTKGFSAYEKVSDEIMNEISPKLDESANHSLKVLLTRSDLVKFAKYTPTEDEHRAILAAAGAWVERY